MKHNPKNQRPNSFKRRAAAVVMVAVTLPVLLGVAALTVDVAYLYNIRGDLQRSADAGALAGASALTGDAMMQVRMGNGGSALSDLELTVEDRSIMFSGLNPTLGTSTTVITAGEITLGWLDMSLATASVQTSGAPSDYNAVQVLTRRTADSANGPIDLLFAQVFGLTISEASASATAAFDDRMAGFDTSSYPGGLLPFTIEQNVFDLDFASGPDQYTFDSGTDTVSTGSDGIREIKLYPYDTAPGNFGLLNIGTPNQGVPALQDHIENGVPPEDFEAEVGTAVLTFYDDDGNSTTYQITGNPGLKVALQSSIETQIGNVVGFFLHNAVTGTGANAVYTITEIRFGRLMDVQLQGPPSGRGLWVQPVSFSGSGVNVAASAPSSGGLVGRMVIAR
ncbi:MAG: hypothetical protein IIC01_04550 [Planctomycetes bacterium]|nr:hypothetical protein [Planctomycetota bacterium]